MDKLFTDGLTEVRELLDDLTKYLQDQYGFKVNDGKKSYRTNATTSRAEGLLESPRNSMRAWTTLAATSENLIAVTWID